MFCKKCGSEINEGLKFCTACGNPLEDKQAESIFISKYAAPKQQANQFSDEDLALIYVKEYEDAALMVLVLSLLALCLPFPLIRLVLGLVAVSRKSKIKNLPLYQIKLNDINLVVRAQSAKRKVKTASALITTAFVLMFVPVILLIITAIVALALFL